MVHYFFSFFLRWSIQSTNPNINITVFSVLLSVIKLQSYKEYQKRKISQKSPELWGSKSQIQNGFFQNCLLFLLYYMNLKQNTSYREIWRGSLPEVAWFSQNVALKVNNTNPGKYLMPFYAYFSAIDFIFKNLIIINWWN